MTEIRAVSLDLDDTLWAGAEAIARAEARVHAWLQRHAPAVARALPPPRLAELRRSLASERPWIAHDFTALRLAALTRALSLYGEDPALAADALEVFLEERSRIDLFADVPEALERLGRRYRLVALTNGNADLARVGIASRFAAIVSARSAGAAKPDARIFLSACAQLGLAPAQVVHAGDHPELDVRAAIRAGLHSAWINRQRTHWTGEPAQAPEFHDLLALCEWLRV